MATTRLDLYNAALLECKERSLASLTEDRAPRRRLDTVWNEGAVKHCLGLARWRFARRFVALSPDPNVTPAIGHQNAFEKPADMVRTVSVTLDARGGSPLLAYDVDGRYFYADVNSLFLCYVSDDEHYGGDLSRWPTKFIRVVSLYLASRIVRPTTDSREDQQDIEGLLAKALYEAETEDALEGPSVPLPVSKWVQARRGPGRGLEQG